MDTGYDSLKFSTGTTSNSALWTLCNCFSETTIEFNTLKASLEIAKTILKFPARFNIPAVRKADSTVEVVFVDLEYRKESCSDEWRR
jgi:hypothetical protein